MGEEESTARALAAKLSEAGIQASASGNGVHWHVEVGPIGSRALLVHCFWYHQSMSGLALGMNPRNARSRSRVKPMPYAGPEYLVLLRDSGARVADGRTRVETEAVASACRWTQGATLDELSRELPFVDERPRAMRALATHLHPGLRWDIAPEPLCELWVYGDGRSCKAALVEEEVTCAFLLGQAQIAYAGRLADIPSAIAAWLVDRVAIAQLAARVPEADLEPHVEFIESNPARWHWSNVRDRIADSRDVLAPLKELIEALASSRIASSFYSYSSMNSFCFSASSHYPWVDEGLPRVAPAGDTYVVGADRCDRSTAIQLIESMLAAYPTKPFFGAGPHHTLPLLAECLHRQGSALAPKLIQRGAWYRLEVSHGSRRCVVYHHHVNFEDGAREVAAAWPSLETAVRAIRHFLEEGAPLDAIENDPDAQNIAKRGPGFMTVGGRTMKIRD